MLGRVVLRRFVYVGFAPSLTRLGRGTTVTLLLLLFFFSTPYCSVCRWFAAPREVVALEKTTMTLHGPGPFGLVGDSGAGKRY